MRLIAQRSLDAWSIRGSRQQPPRFKASGGFLSLTMFNRRHAAFARSTAQSAAVSGASAGSFRSTGGAWQDFCQRTVRLSSF